MALTMPWRAFVPLPRPELHFWNTNLLDPFPALQSTAGLLMLVLVAAFLWRRPVALGTFGIGAVGLLIFGYSKYLGVLRHHGHWWLLFTAAPWLSGGLDGQRDRRSWRARIFLALLVLHASAAMFASWMDLLHPFSNGAATAALIRHEGLDRHPLLGYREPLTATVALALGRSVYFPSRGVFTTHPSWGPEQRELTEGELRCAARELTRRKARDIVLIMNQELPPWDELASIDARRGAIESSEDYYLYWLRHDRLGRTVEAAHCGGEG